MNGEQFKLNGKVALVAGSGRGLMSSLALALAEAGADVAVSGNNKRELEQAANAVTKLGRKALAITAELSKPAEVQAAVNRVASELGKIDILVTNAGLTFARPIGEVTPEEWHKVIDANLTSVFLCAQAAGKHMVERKAGRVINVISALAMRGLPNGTAYCAAVGGVLQFTKALSLEWAKQGIRVNSIGPGWLAEKEISPEVIARDPITRFIPLRRPASPDDLKGILVYLASDASDFVTGQTFFVDGGTLAHG